MAGPSSLPPAARSPWTWTIAAVATLVGALGGGPGINALLGDETTKRLDKIDARLDRIEARQQAAAVESAQHSGEHRALDTRLANEIASRVEADSHLEDKINGRL